MKTIFLSLYWVCYNIASVLFSLCFVFFCFWQGGTVGSYSPTRGWTPTPCIGRWSVTTEPPGKSPIFSSCLSQRSLYPHNSLSEVTRQMLFHPILHTRKLRLMDLSAQVSRTSGLGIKTHVFWFGNTCFFSLLNSIHTDFQVHETRTDS